MAGRSYPTKREEYTVQVASGSSQNDSLGEDDKSSATPSLEEASRKEISSSVTEYVSVRSSEHVAEIVGRQGLKIKAVGTATSTIIKTPNRGEEPVFVITGQKENVAVARSFIKVAEKKCAEKMNKRNKSEEVGIAESLRHLVNRQSLPSNTTTPVLSSSTTITLKVYIPYHLVGLVVGAKGATIRRIQQETHTHIVTPGKDKDPVFEVSGLQENVENAKNEIQAYIISMIGNHSVNTNNGVSSNGAARRTPASFSGCQYSFAPSLASSHPEIDISSMTHFENPIVRQLLECISFDNQTAIRRNPPPELLSRGALNMYSHSERNAIDQHESGSDRQAPSSNSVLQTRFSPNFSNIDFPS